MSDLIVVTNILLSLLAFVALYALRTGRAWAVPVVWVFNIEGSLDLANALVQGVAHSAASSMGAAFWIPAILVPALLVTHGLIYWILLRRETFAGEFTTPAAA